MGIKISEYDKLLANLGRRPKPEPQPALKPEPQPALKPGAQAEIKISVPMAGIPKARPRFGSKGRVYSPSNDAEAEMAARIARAFTGGKIETDCAIAIHLYQDRTEISFRPQPGRRKHRGDIDNIAKFVLDAIVKSGILKDDRIVKSLVVEIL